MAEGLAAIDAAIRAGELARRPAAAPALLAAAARRRAACSTRPRPRRRSPRFGLRVPAAVTAPDPDALLAAAAALRYPLALKGLGIAHKSEAGAVVLDIADARRAARRRRAHGRRRRRGFLAEEMVQGPVAELLIGVARDDTGLWR